MFRQPARLSTPASAVDRRNPPLASSSASRQRRDSRYSVAPLAWAVLATAIPRAGTRARRVALARAERARGVGELVARRQSQRRAQITKHDGELIVRVGTSEARTSPSGGERKSSRRMVDAAGARREAPCGVTDGCRPAASGTNHT